MNRYALPLAFTAAMLCATAVYAQQPAPFKRTVVGNPGDLPPDPVLDGKQSGDLNAPLFRLSDEAMQNLVDKLPSEDDVNTRSAFLDKAPKAVVLEELMKDNSQVAQVTVEVSLEDGHEAMSWVLTPLDVPVLISKLDEKKEVFGKVSTVPSESGYKGVTLKMLSPTGRSYGPVTVYQNAITLDGKPRFLQDRDRDLEFWLFGTARSFADRVRAIELLEVYTFADCLKLGHTLVETSPRQCIIPDGTTFLETNETLTEKDKKIDTFDKCLEAENPLINTFPRKCIAPGGRVYVEPPRLK